MKVLNISGGGTRIVGQYGAAKGLYETGWSADVITGISAGAILALPIAMGKWEALDAILLNGNLKYTHFFKKSPVNEKGNVRFWAGLKYGLKWLFGMSPDSLGDFSRLERTIKSVISEEDFRAWQLDDMSVEVYVGSVSFTDGSRKYWRLKELPYDEAVRAIRASASIPVFCQPVKMFHRETGKYHFHYDGGVRDFIGTAWALENLRGITEVIDIFSKPMDNRVLRFDQTRTKNLIRILGTTLTILETEVSKGDEEIAELIATREGIQMWGIYIPVNLKHVYDIDPDRLQQLYMNGYREGRFIFDYNQSDL